MRKRKWKKTMRKIFKNVLCFQKVIKVIASNIICKCKKRLREVKICKKLRITREYSRRTEQIFLSQDKTPQNRVHKHKTAVRSLM